MPDIFQVRRPEQITIQLGGGHWIRIKKEINTGETRQVFKKMSVLRDGKPFVEGIDYGPLLSAQYLIDWSMLDANGDVIPIADQDLDVKVQAMENLPPAGSKRIRDVIEAHHAEVEKESEEEKNDQAVASGSSVTSRSRKRSAGGMNGSLNSQSTSTTS